MLRIHMSVEHSDVQSAPVPATQTVEPPPETFVHVESLTKHFPLKTGFFASICSRGAESEGSASRSGARATGRVSIQISPRAERGPETKGRCSEGIRPPS